MTFKLKPELRLIPTFDLRFMGVPPLLPWLSFPIVMRFFGTSI
jgi:hypothetical protein